MIYVYRCVNKYCTSLYDTYEFNMKMSEHDKIVKCPACEVVLKKILTTPIILGMDKLGRSKINKR